jgi:hypothetical protein
VHGLLFEFANVIACLFFENTLGVAILTVILVAGIDSEGGSSERTDLQREGQEAEDRW